MYHSQFTTVSDEDFNSFADVKPEVKKHTAIDMCPECNIPMVLSGNDYSCLKCGIIEENIGEAPQTYEKTGNTSVRVTIGNRRGKYYNVTSDYSEVQKKLILDQLIQNNNAYTGFKFPRELLQKAANGYNSVQKSFIDEPMADGTVAKKKFVRRGNIKDEVLAAFIYYECIRIGAARKKKDIATMMKLSTNGFSNGESILRTLHFEGKVNIPLDKEPYEDYLDRYLETLNITNDNYRNFILACVDYSEKNKIGMNSQISSKIVAVLWIVITNCNLDITIDKLETAADNIKKSTFMKFHKIVIVNLRLFAHIFTRHAIPIFPSRK
jgi:transcription initiation factor TFIIIB Brf1 subunit/transcription initiation factor TFIIB